MANDETYFTSRLTGERVSPATIVAEELAALQELVESGESSITDANVGSEVRNLLEAMAASQYQYRYELDRYSVMLLVRYATGGWLDDIGFTYGLTRKTGVTASGICIFRISAPLTLDYTIPEGTKVINKDGYTYSLNTDVTIKAGETNATGMVIADGIGSAYNCVAYAIKGFDTEYDLRQDLTVTNQQSFYNGLDEEDDDTFRERILEFLRGGKFGSIQYYKSLCEEIDGVHDVNIVAPEVLNSIETGRHSIVENGITTECNDCTAVCVVNLNDKTDKTGTLTKEVTNVLSDQNNIVFGHEFHVQEAHLAPVYFRVDYYAEDGITVSDDEIHKCLTQFFFGGTYEGKQTIIYSGVYTGGTIQKETIIDALENIEGVHHVVQLYLLGWHKDLAGVEVLENYKSKTGVKASDGSTWQYINILDYPDEDDATYKSNLVKYKSITEKVPVWKKITDADMNSDQQDSNGNLYQLCVNDYYFYKIKNAESDSDEAQDLSVEHPIRTEFEDYWLWGIKSFDTINLNPDVVAFNGAMNSRQPDLDYFNYIRSTTDVSYPNPHQVWVRKLDNETGSSKTILE